MSFKNSQDELYPESQRTKRRGSKELVSKSKKFFSNFQCNTYRRRRFCSPRSLIVATLLTFVSVSFWLYLETNWQEFYNEAEIPLVAQLRRRIQQLEEQSLKNIEQIINLNRRIEVQEVEKSLKEKQKQTSKPAKRRRPHKPVKKKPNRAERVNYPQKTFKVESVANNMCPIRTAKTDLQMLDAYMEIPFDNPNGGVWKQGFKIKYDDEQIQEEKRLEVVVIPHSHCDPGWLRTFEEYYEELVENILDGMLKHLDDKKDMKFIYAEMSFFELWWSTLTEEQKEKTRSFLRSGQLEIVTGGWVMTDEANARSFSIVMELIEGHEFLMNQLQYKPQTHWSIDPFGLSPTLAKVIKSSGFEHMAIQRVHYAVKKHLAKRKLLEFRWRQLYAGESAETDIRTHMFPFASYDPARSCGPDPVICCEFDFGPRNCPLGDDPEPITKENLDERATTLADQYRKKAQLYRMNTILVPIGDDFRYSSEKEWIKQYKNYKKLFKYMNNQKELNIHARFGTLKDYFDVLDQRLSEEPPSSPKKELPILSGDFFTYSDRDDHYWSGYFTSRPFYKHMDRTVQHYVRTADILHSLVLWKAKSEGRKESPLPTNYYDHLVESRRTLSLFQHHDGMTGTAKDHVVVDYGKKMLAAIEKCSFLIMKASEYLLGVNNQNEALKPDMEFFLDKLPEQVKAETGSSIILHNSLALERHEVVCLRVTSSKVRIQHGSNVNIKQQIQPLISFQQGQFQLQANNYELCFEATIKPLGFERYLLIEGTDSNHMVKIEVNEGADKNLFSGASLITLHGLATLSNNYLTANFYPSTGYLKSIKYTNEKESLVQMDFLHYKAKTSSGAYLFLPDEPSKSLTATNNAFVIMKGDVRQTFVLKGPQEALIYQKVYLDFNSDSLDFVTRVDVRLTYNFELAMRFRAADFMTEDEQFYTDLNGFQMIRRKRFSKLPIQANFFPMTTAAFIDSNGKRLTLLGRQALAVARLKPGHIEFLLERRLMQDDGRGLGQGVTDNLQTESRFRLIIEKRQPQQISDDNRAGFLSLSALQSSNKLNYPINIMHASSGANTIPESWSPLIKPFPCDTHLFAFRTLSEPTVYTRKGERSTKSKFEASMILERQGTECLIKEEKKLEGCEKVSNGNFKLSDYFPIPVSSIKSTTLTGIHELGQSSSGLQLNPMDLKAVKLEF